MYIFGRDVYGTTELNDSFSEDILFCETGLSYLWSSRRQKAVLDFMVFSATFHTGGMFESSISHIFFSFVKLFCAGQLVCKLCTNKLGGESSFFATESVALAGMK